MSSEAAVDYDDVGFVHSSAYRTAVLAFLAGEGPATPTGLATATEFRIAHVSRALQQLRKRDLVELLVPEARSKGRIYGATEAGEAVARRVESVDGGEDA